MRAIVSVALMVAWIGAAGAGEAPVCPGDCNGDDSVAVNELILGVNISLGSADVSACPAMDGSGDGTVSVSELITAVNASLGGCGGVEPPTYADVQAIWDRSCAVPGCHAPPVNSQQLNLSADASFDEIVNVDPVNANAVAQGFLLVDPGDPMNSFILRKVAGPPGPGLGGQMPAFAAPLSDAEVATIREWIAAGALP